MTLETKHINFELHEKIALEKAESILSQAISKISGSEGEITDQEMSDLWEALHNFNKRFKP